MRLFKLSLVAGLASLASCTSATTSATPSMPTPDPRVGLKAGMYDAAEASTYMKVLAKVQPPDKFKGSTNSDLAFTGKYAIQGNYNGFQVWDISNPAMPTLTTSYFCPASQSDVSVYKNLLFVSGEGGGGRLDCLAGGVPDTVSPIRLRGIRIFDITDIKNPKYISNVQTCRGSHTHTVVEDPKDKENVYIYVSGSAGIRSPNELAGCVRAVDDPNSAYFRIEVIKVPLANPTAAAIVSSPRFFENLGAPPRHGETAVDIAARQKQVADAKARGEYTAVVFGNEQVLPPQFARQLLDSLVKVRGGTGAPTAQDSATLRTNVQSIIDKMFGANRGPNPLAGRGPTQCHDITVYPALGRAGGACEGYGFLLDISDVANPRRLAAVSDSNFSYWHSATFNNDGTKILFSDEWGGGGAPKCRSTDPKEWGADAIFTIEPGNQLKFQSYYKLPAVQTQFENCVAHNGSLIPIPGRDVMVQSWYQGGVSVFDFTDAAHPMEIAYFDRGPSDSTRQGPGGTWSVYWYNGAMFSSEIGRGFDVMELTPSPFVSQNEIDAAKTVHLDYFNAQGQPKLSWPPSFALARAYTDQLERKKCLSGKRIAEIRSGLDAAERSSGAARRDALTAMTAALANDARSSCDAPRVGKLSMAVRDLAGLQP